MRDLTSGAGQKLGAHLLSRRGVLGAGAAVLAPMHARAQAVPFDAIVGEGAGAVARFATLQAAVAAAPATGVGPYRVFVGRGEWREKLIIDKPNVQLIGADRAGSIITHDTAAGMCRPDGNAWGTWGCATLIVRAPGFRAENLTIENAFDYVADLAAPQFERIGSNGAQAVALMLDAGADQTVLERVSVLGHQDTLFVDAGRTLVRDCLVSGSVDFIFGAGAAWFEGCELRSRYRPGLQRNHGWVAAPSTARTQQYGLVFNGCRLTREASVPLASVALGRAWRPTRTFADGRYGDPDAVGHAAFRDCWMDEHISADGWDEMGYTDRSGGRVFLSPQEARFGEYGSTGPGAFVNRRRPQLSPSAARSMRRSNVLADWEMEE